MPEPFGFRHFRNDVIRRLLGERFELLDDLALWRHADRLVGELATFEVEQRRDRLNAELRGEHAFFIHIHLADFDSGAFVLGDFIKDGAQHFARTAPLRPKIDENGDIGFQNFGLKIILRDFNYCFASHKTNWGLVVVGMEWDQDKPRGANATKICKRRGAANFTQR